MRQKQRSRVPEVQIWLSLRDAGAAFGSFSHPRRPSVACYRWTCPAARGMSRPIVAGPSFRWVARGGTGRFGGPSIFTPLRAGRFIKLLLAGQRKGGEDE